MRRNSNWLLAACLATLSAIPSTNYQNLRKLNMPARNTLSSLIFSRNMIHSSPSFAFAEINSPSSISYLDSKTSKEIDNKLMSSPGFSVDQLMELAGLSVAVAVRDYTESRGNSKNKKLLIICGPGNNGGDGLVAARHLFHFGFKPTIIYPQPGQSSLFVNLVAQCLDLGIPIESKLPESFDDFQILVDGIFGFSFHGPAKQPFDEIIARLATSQVPVLSIDVPSGWDVEDGDIFETNFMPTGLISLTAPKKCARSYLGVHYLGGSYRFLPPKLAKEYDLILPSYPGVDQIVRLSPPNTPSSEWILHLTEEGYPYFHNTITKQSKWAEFEFPTLPEKDKISVILTTASTLKEGRYLARDLVQKKLVACVNLVPSITSIYEWDGKIEESNEVQLIIKTRSSLVPEVTKQIKVLHSYAVPEIIAIDIQGGNEDYLRWVLHETKI